ncbi:hypothetical protein, partial [Klebsiella pneumoniae]|uniref:hypothetical protein n=1 Tax=Klebsiella pneumoniae TaxID=573 RepID=UPI00346C6358
EWVHVQLHQQKGMISLSPPTICNSAHSNVGFVAGKNAFEAPSSRALLEMVHTPELAATLQSVISIHRRFQPKADSSQSPLK